MTISKDDFPSMATVKARIFSLPDRPPFMTVYDLAEFYQVKPKRIMEQVRRRIDRFPDDFIFELEPVEMEYLVTQNAAPNRLNRGILIAFTREGALQLSSVLTGPVADEVSVIIMRAFAAMERAAFRQMRVALLKHSETWISRQPRLTRLREWCRKGMTFEEMYRTGSVSRRQLETDLRELYWMDQIGGLPEGVQPDLFANG